MKRLDLWKMVKALGHQLVMAERKLRAAGHDHVTREEVSELVHHIAEALGLPATLREAIIAAWEAAHPHPHAPGKHGPLLGHGTGQGPLGPWR